MNYTDILLIGIGLSMDAFAVTVTNAMVYKNIKASRAVMAPVFFGAFQGIMPFLGFYTGALFSNIIEKIAGPLTFVILGIIGGGMIKDGIIPENNKDKNQENNLTYKTLFLQAVATSIDAFAVGVSFSALKAVGAMDMPVYFACIIIAVSTFLLSILALLLGKRLGGILENKAQIAGGLILILIGIKALF